jgi:isoleucyl-tRNA synthetase
MNIQHMDVMNDEQQIETDIMSFWELNKIHQKSIDKAKRCKKTIIYDGPPFPTGPPHHGHMMTSAVKDTIIRYLMATGHYVPRLLGWDMYGPNVNSKSEEYIEEWIKVLGKLGRWVDGKGYRTSSLEFTESVWWIYKTLSTKGHIAIERGIGLYCHTCSSFCSDFERHHTMSSIQESTIYYKVKVEVEVEAKEGAEAGPSIPLYLLVWEMRPWTLNATEAYVINKNAVYVRRGDLICAKDSKHTEQQFDEVVSTDLLLSMIAEDPVSKCSIPIIHSSMVDASKGTGVMQAAPSMDEKSYDVIGSYQSSKMLETDLTSGTDDIIRKLQAMNVLISIRNINRQVSVCSKCNTRLVSQPCYGPFYKVSKCRSDIIASLDQVYWEPKSSKDTIMNYALNARDWFLARSRQVGTPVPVWFNDQGESLIIGSYAELKEYRGPGQDQGGSIIDLSDIQYAGKTYKWCKWRLDNWMDSACMPYGSVGYPFKKTKMELESSLFPCLLAVEGIDQIHGWFFTTVAISSSISSRAAYINVITNGLVLGSTGQKMSKSHPQTQQYGVLDTIKEFGADNYRVYLMQNRLLSGINFHYDQDKIAIAASFSRNLYNAYKFIDTYTKNSVNINFKPTRITNITDNWILQSLDDYLQKYHSHMNKFKVPQALSLSSIFLTSIRKYINYNRKRLMKDDTISITVLIRVFYYFLLTTAPFVPFISEYLYQKIRHHIHTEGAAISIHLCQIPKTQWRMNTRFLASSDLMFQIIDLVKKARITTETTLIVYIPDISLIRGVDNYIKEVTERDIIYNSDIESVLQAEVIIQHVQIYSQEDIEQMKALSLKAILDLEFTGYYRTLKGLKTYPGQYLIKYTSSLEPSICSKGLVMHYPSSDSVSSGSLVDSKELITKGQIIGRRIHTFIKVQCPNQKCIVYVAHPPLDKINSEKCRTLLTNLNRFTLPIINQSIYQYKNHSTFAHLALPVYGNEIHFYLSPIDKVLDAPGS